MGWFFALAACASPPAATLSPDSGTSAGYFAVEVAWSGPEPTDVSLGGVRAFVTDVRADSFTIEVQGAPEPGPAALRFTAGDEEVEVPDAFTYAPPIDPAFDRLVAMGASVTAGVLSSGLSPLSAKQSAPALLAQASGAYLGLPLLAEGLLPPMPPSVLPGDCVLPLYDDYATDSFVAAIDTMSADSGGVDWARGRQDPALEVRNLGVPGAPLDEVAFGPESSDIGGLFFSHLLLQPAGGLTDPIDPPELARVVAAAPTLVVAPDLLGNDLLDSILAEDGLDPSAMRDLEDTRPALDRILADVAGTGAWFVVADIPSPSRLPAATAAIARARAAGVSEDTIAADLATIDAAAAAYSAALREDAAAYDRVVVVPLAAAVDELAATGLDAAGQHLTTAPLGGLVGLDGVHFTATGNAVLYGVFADALDATLGTSLPRPDLDSIAAADPLSPANLEAAGVDRSACP